MTWLLSNLVDRILYHLELKRITILKFETYLEFMANKGSSHSDLLNLVPQNFPSLGPTLLICMGYIDPGKWAASVDGGARFRSSHVFLVLAFHCSSVLCQYLSACIGVVTKKNLAQICKEEYSKLMCILLGVQAEISAVILDLNMILGVAYSLNLLVGLDIFTCIFFSPIDAALFPLLSSLLDRREVGGMLMGIAGFDFILCLLGVLMNQSEVHLAMNGLFPRLKSEDIYSIMGLLGASMMPHNLYLHSAFVQRQQEQKLPNVSISAICHDNLFAILLIFSGIFIINYVVMLSTALVCNSAGLAMLSRQDVLMLIDQAFQSPMSAFLLFLVLFFASQVTTLSWNIGSQVVLSNLFGTDPPVWFHRITVKVFAIFLAFCFKTSKTEGLYQTLIFSQVVLAMLLPPSVIPLFRVASSRMIMGAYKVSGFVEILSLSAFLGMVTTNLIFLVEMLFGDNNVMNYLEWDNIGSHVSLPFFILVLAACASLVLILWFAATPLKSASIDIEMRSWDLQKTVLDQSNRREDHDLNVRIKEVEDHVAEKAIIGNKCGGDQSNSLVKEFEIDLPEFIADYEHNNGNDGGEDKAISFSSRAPQERLSADEVRVVADKIRSHGSFDIVRVEADSEHLLRDREEAEAWELEEPPEISENSFTLSSEDPSSLITFGGKSDDVGNGSGSLSRLSGLGRAARRQLAAILDEFWGQLFDFHGQVTQEARGKGLDVLLGLDKKTALASLGDVASSVKPPDSEKRSTFMSESRGYESEQHQILSNMDLSHGHQRGSSSWSLYMQSLDAYVKRSSNNSGDVNERRYSSLRLPSYSENRDSQPATVHGHQIASSLSRIASDMNMDAARMPLNPPTSSNSIYLISNYNNQLPFGRGQNDLGYSRNMNYPSTAASALDNLKAEAERDFSDNIPVFANVGNAGSSSCPRKYHSLPDISGLALPKRSSLAGGTQRSGLIGPNSSLGRNLQNFRTSEHGPLAFDELSPSKVYGDVFGPSSNSNFETKSLWSRQPSEQLFGIVGRGGICSSVQECTSVSEAKLLQSFRYCIMRILKLEGSGWLFQQTGGSDEELIDRIAAREKYAIDGRYELFYMGDSSCILSEMGSSKSLAASLPCCGEGCVWKIGLVVCFGVWCIHRILDMSLVESRPELWGKYTYVLNRLQGILELAFFKTRLSLSPCFCLQIPFGQGRGIGPQLQNGLSSGGKGSRSRYTANMLLELIKEVEVAVACRKGRTGTAAGDVAFPKGKENLASVLKRYKRRLSNKPVGVPEGWPVPRRASVPPISFTP